MGRRCPRLDGADPGGRPQDRTIHDRRRPVYSPVGVGACGRGCVAPHHHPHAPAVARAGGYRPNKNDLAKAPVLSGWVPIRSEYGTSAHLVGEVGSHPASIGPMIRTSPLCGLDTDFRWARTVSRWYRLEARSTPEGFYRKWGRKADGISAMSIEVWRAQAICAAEQISEGIREE
ncbi:DUF6634 family protein [Thalassococcus sp. S3]|uniref:DUF6634 family protein n=1 Tax=Thalassococcus sp. S3 TaxID=2017482 RepID=UPI00352EA229